MAEKRRIGGGSDSRRVVCRMETIAMIRPFAFLSLVVLSLAARAATAADPVDSGWPEVARAEDGPCTLRVTGNGQFYRIAAAGMGSGAEGRMVLVNGDMKPLDWAVRATDDGAFARYYIPFRWHRDGENDPFRSDSWRHAIFRWNWEGAAPRRHLDGAFDLVLQPRHRRTGSIARHAVSRKHHGNKNRVRL